MSSTGKEAFIIVGTGRSGSSLLSAILSDSGANFNMDYHSGWNPAQGGAYEHPYIVQAARWFGRLTRVRESIIPNALAIRYCRNQVTKNINSLFEGSQFVKHPEATWLLHFIANMGYKPTIIVSYRNFEGFARSRYLRFGWDFPRIVDAYIRYNTTSLLQLQIFGGCVVDFGELTNPDETQWAETIADLCHLDAEIILQKRNERLKDSKSNDLDLTALDSIVMEGRTQAVYDALKAYRGQVVKAL